MSKKYKDFIKTYWNYYRELENELFACKKYVEFSFDNRNVYSIEFLKLYLSVCSEIDVVGKRLAQLANSSFKPDDKTNNILKWWYEVEKHYKLDNSILEDVQCSFIDTITVKPWNNFQVISKLNKKGASYLALDQGKKIPEWWSLYNKVKHNRTLAIPKGHKTYYTKATLWNLIYSFAALYILEKVLMDSQGTAVDIQSLYDISILFEKKTIVTERDIDEMFKHV